MANSTYEFIENDTFPLDGGFCVESYWSGGILEVFPNQVGGTCCQHAMTKITEFMHLYNCQKEGKTAPFSKLSVQFLLDCSASKAYENSITFDHMGPREISWLALTADGILAYEDYALHGLRGEHGWIENRSITNKTRYGVTQFNWIKNVGSSPVKHDAVGTAVDKGPIYIDFPLYDGYYTRTSPLPHGGDTPDDTHAVCCVGYGTYIRNADFTPYLLYVNTYGPDWGDKGRGRVELGSVKNALLPQGIRTRLHSRRYPPKDVPTSRS